MRDTAPNPASDGLPNGSPDPSRRRAFAALALVLAACQTPAPAAVTAGDAWARPAAAGADGAAYLVLRNARPDTAVVVGVASPAARAASLHETMTMGAGAAAMVHMTPLPRAAVPPGDSLVLAPGGRHVMLEGLTRALAAGDRVPLVVRLASGDSVRVDALVRAP